MTQEVEVEIVNVDKFDSAFYITVKGQNGKVLFDTMGGYRLYSRTHNTNEFERVMSYNTYAAAAESIHRIQKDAHSQEVRRWNFAVLEVQVERTSKTIQYKPVRSSKADEIFQLQELISEFEDFYIKKHKSWDLASMSTRRNNNSTGYVHEGLQKAFKAYCVIVRG